MKLKVVLFDLDGTLLPMDQDVFIRAYFDLLARALAQHGYDPSELSASVWRATASMIKNDGRSTNEEVFWKTFAGIYGANVRADEPHFEAFYHQAFDQVQASCGYTPRAAEAVHAIRALGLRVALATNPVFPAIATQKRMAWAGLNVADFDLYTTYENSRYCKPNLAYYEEILQKLGVCAEECLMVGNDVAEDMIASKLGMRVFLITDCLINKDERDITVYPHGSFDELLPFVRRLSDEKG